MSISSDIGVQPAAAKLQLEPILDLGAAERLHAQLQGLRGRPLDIDSSQVERPGGLSLQVLLSARRTWASDGVRASVNDASQAFQDSLALFAAPAFTIDQQGPDA